MRHFVVLSVLLGLFTSALNGQAPERPDYVFFGFTAEPGAETVNNPDLHRYGLQDRDKRGWDAAVAHAIHSSWLWVVGDVSRHYGELHDAVGCIPEACPPPYSTVQVGKTAKTNVLVGPQVAFSFRSRLQPFGRVLIGASRQTAEYPYFERMNRSYAESAVNLAYGGGGGCDLRLSDRVSIRLLQLDLLAIRGYKPQAVVPGPYTSQISTARDNDNSVRLSTGLVFSF